MGTEGFTVLILCDNHLWGGEEGEVVARVGVEGGGEGQAEPKPGGGHVGAK